MNALVRGHDAYTGLQIGEQTSDWDTAASGTMYRVPLLGETMHLERESFPKVNEMGATGGLESWEFGRGIARGELTVRPRFDATWFNLLLAYALGAEDVVAGLYLDRAETTPTGATLGNTHIYTMGATLPNGLTIEVFKAGDDITAGHFERYVGCLITRMVWEQPEDDHARVTFEFVGKIPSVEDPATTTELSSVEGAVITAVRDLSRSDSEVIVGGGSPYLDLNVRSFTVTMDRHIEAEAAFLNDPDELAKPGVTEQRDITLELRGLLESKLPTGTDIYYPLFEFLAASGLSGTPANAESYCNIIYAAATATVATGKPYGARLEVPKIVWEDVQAPISETGAVPWTATARGLVGTVVGHTSYPSTGETDLRVMTYVDPSDDPTPPEYSAL